MSACPVYDVRKVLCINLLNRQARRIYDPIGLNEFRMQAKQLVFRVSLSSSERSLAIMGVTAALLARQNVLERGAQDLDMNRRLQLF
jgi:hypothetical protein